MDANEVKKKFFDVTPPVAAAPKTPAKKRQLVVVDSSAEAEDITPLPSEFNENDGAPEVSKVEVKREKVIQPPTLEATPQPEPNDTAEEAVQPVTEPKEEPVIEVAKNEKEATETASTEVIGVNPISINEEKLPEPKEEPAPEPEDKDVPITSTFTAIDSLPDDNQKAADAVKTDTQEPRLYDTKAYHIPIKETTHSHRHLMSALLVGFLFAILVIGSFLFFANNTTSTKSENQTTNNSTSDTLKVYKSEKAGFSIKYPNNWTMETSANPETVTLSGPSAFRVTIYQNDKASLASNSSKIAVNSKKEVNINGYGKAVIEYISSTDSKGRTINHLVLKSVEGNDIITPPGDNKLGITVFSSLYPAPTLASRESATPEEFMQQEDTKTATQIIESLSFN